MKDGVPPGPGAALRPPWQVMRLSRLGAAFPTRLSFLRILLRRLGAESAQVTRPVWRMDAGGYGHAVYSVRLGGHVYSLVAVSSRLAPQARTDRVIAEAWDSAYVLYDGVPGADEIARIVATAPMQEAARFTRRDLVLSRANKSVRLWDHVTGALRAGRGLDTSLLLRTGYLMRTTAVYGNGKFGIADRGVIADRPGLDGPFMAEMLAIWLIRGFTHDLVAHVGGAPLPRRVRRHLGIGNSTGLGMAPFLVSHPLLLDAWMQARETALARVRAIPALDDTGQARVCALAARAAAHLAGWQVPDPQAQSGIDRLRAQWAVFTGDLAGRLRAPRPIDAMIRHSEGFEVSLQELAVALAIEPFGDLVDDLGAGMATPLVPRLDPLMPVAQLRAALARDWEWAVSLDFAGTDAEARFWYVSEAKQEPRLGLRRVDPGSERESPLDIARRVRACALALEGWEDTLAAFLAVYPVHRSAVRRMQTLIQHPYSELRDNLIGADCRPVDMLRCKLAFFGAAGFDPKSDRWTRITLAQGAPLFDELDAPDDWWLPAFVAP